MSTNDYLWDRTGPPDETIERLERVLTARRFDLSRQPCPVVTRRRSRTFRYAAAAALGLAVSAAAAVAGYQWRLVWPEGRPWPIVRAAPAATAQPLVVGTPWVSAGEVAAVVQVARIGRMTVRPASQITLQTTSSALHVVQLDRGGLSVRVFAPPGRLRVQTPSGLVTDLGCAFDVAVDIGGLAEVRVRSGWVELENAHGAVLVPAGAASRMVPGRTPATPVFDDADTAFRSAVRQVEDGAPVRAVAGLTQARGRDAVTLLVLASRLNGNDRVTVVNLAARLSTPPADVDVQAVASGDDGALWRWHAALPLPPPKQWWRNWRDAWPGAP